MSWHCSAVESGVIDRRARREDDRLSNATAAGRDAMVERWFWIFQI